MSGKDSRARKLAEKILEDARNGRYVPTAEESDLAHFVLERLGDSGAIRVVVWIDSSLQNGQVDEHSFPTPERITSVGYLVAACDTHLVLARDDMGNGDYRGLLAIPKVCIVKEGSPAWEKQ